MKLASTKKFTSKSKNKYRYLSFAIFAFLSVIPAQKALSSRPSLYSVDIPLSMSYSQCRTKASKVANLVFSNVRFQEDEARGFLLIGANTATISASLYCMKQGTGSHFVVYTSGGFFDSPFAQDDQKIINQIKTYMLR